MLKFSKKAQVDWTYYSVFSWWDVLNCILAPMDSDTVCQSLCAGQKPLASQCQSHCDWHHDSATTDAKSVALLLPADGPEPNPSTFPIQNAQLRVIQKAACKNSSFFYLLHTTRVHSWLCLLHSVHCIMVDHCSISSCSALNCAWHLRSAHLQNLGHMSFSLLTLWSCFIQANKVSPNFMESPIYS